MSIYQECKSHLKFQIDNIKTNDKGYFFYESDVALDNTIRQMDYNYLLKDKISKAQFTQYSNWLSAYVCKRKEQFKPTRNE